MKGGDKNERAIKTIQTEREAGAAAKLGRNDGRFTIHVYDHALRRLRCAYDKKAIK